MKQLIPRVVFVFLGVLTAADAVAAVERTAQECRVRAGLVGDQPLTLAPALTMYNCVNYEIGKIDRLVQSQMQTFRTWRDEHERLLVSGGGQLAARTCQDEKDNRRYIENRLGDVGDLRRKYEGNAEKYEKLYRDLIFELNVVFLGTSAAGEVLGQLTRSVNNDLVQRLEELDREQKALQHFYVDLQQTRFQDACGSPTVNVPPPASGQCKWQTRAAYNSIRGLHRSNATGYVCTCPPDDGRSVWPAADSERCGPYPSETSGASRPPAPAPSRARQPSPGSSGGWQPVQ